MNGQAVCFVPVYCNLTTESDYKSSYKVTETTQIAGYTTYADTKEVTQADTLKIILLTWVQIIQRLIS